MKINGLYNIISKFCRSTNKAAESPKTIFHKSSNTQPVTDVLQLSNRNSRWLGDRTKFIPETFWGSDIPLHHEVNSINVLLRQALKDFKDGKINSLPEEIQKTVLDVDKQFSKLTPLKKDIIVYRGRREHPVFEENNFDFRLIDKSKVGDVIVPDTAYSYTANNKSLALNFGNPEDVLTLDGKPPRALMYEIRIPQGAKVSLSNDYGGEVLMPRGAEYRLISKDVDKTTTNVVLEYILPNS